MDQGKIGKFILESRKKKKLTQAELADKLGVSEKSISNWENGRNMPDLSLFKPLCETLDISINELMSGEKVSDEEYQEKFEENIINTINYGNKKRSERNKIVGIFLIIFGVLVTITAMSIFKSESSWGSVYSILGIIISLVGISRLIYKMSYPSRLIINFSYFIVFTGILFAIDYVGVINLNQPPRFATTKTTIDNMIIYETPFYNLYRINFDTYNEYYVLDNNKEYTKDTVPNIPFDRDTSGIDNLIKYQSKEFDDNKRINLIDDLPLSEKVIEINTDVINSKLEIKYTLERFYSIDINYFKQSMVYNTLSIFLLLDYIDTIKYSFNETYYYVTRESVEDLYPNLNLIKKPTGVDKYNFNEYIEKEILREDMVNWWYKEFFITSNIKSSDKLIVRRDKDKIITDKNIINDVYNIFHRSKEIEGVVTLDGTNTTLHFYNNEEETLSLYIWLYENENWGSCFGFDEKEYLIPGLDGSRIVELLKN